MTDPVSSARGPVTVFCFALALRAAYLAQMAHADLFRVLVGDGAVYHEWGRRIANGDWLGHEVFYQAPLYPYVLGVIYAVAGADPFWVRLVQILLGSAACVCLYHAGRRFFSPAVGAWAGCLLAVYPTAIFFDGLVQKSSLDIFVTTALLWQLGNLSRWPGARGWMLAGVLVGALALTRENALGLVPIVLAWLWLGFGERAADQRRWWAACLVAGVALVLVPVGMRNVLVGGEFHLTTAQLGPNFYIGNHDGATGGYVSLRAGRGRAEVERVDATELAEEAVGHRLGPGEVSRFWTRRALAWIADNPVPWARLTLWKWMLVWHAVDVTDTEDPVTFAEQSPLLGLLSRLFHFGILCPLAALGVWATWGDRRRLWVLYAIVLTLALSVTLFFVVARYRHPLVPVLVLFAAAGVGHVVQSVRARRWRDLAVGGVVAVAVGAVVNWRLFDPDTQRAPTHYNLGVQLAAEEDLDRARDHFAEATRLDPKLGAAWANLGIVLAMRGQPDEAERHFREALRREPSLVEARANLAVLLLQQGRSREAIAEFREAVRRRPTWAEAHRGLGQALAADGQLAEAVAPLRRAETLATAAHDDALAADVRATLATLGSVDETPGR